MSVLTVSNVNKSFGTSVVLKDVSFVVNKQEKVAIIGDNGEGKTTLLKIITGELEKDSGTIIIDKNSSFGYLSQKVIQNSDNTLLDEMYLSFKNLLDMEKDMAELLKKMETSNDIKLVENYSHLHDKYELSGGYEYKYQVCQMLATFGFDSSYYNRKIISFSGGEKTRAALVKLLLNKPSILLLDEPTNHLDLIMIEWLEKFLKSYSGTVIIVNHDQYFIDNVATKIVEIEHHTATSYSGNYSFYLKEKEERYQAQMKAYNVQSKEIKRYEMLIKKFKPKPTKTGFAKALETRLARMERIEKPNNSKKQIHANLGSNLDPYDVKVHICDNLLFGYNNVPLTEPFTLTIRNQDKICIMGQNGCGKTTLLKTMLDNSYKISGINTDVRPNLKCFYFDQTQQLLDDNLTLFDTIRYHFPLMDNTEVRSALGRFLFSDDDVFKEVSSLSGGEKIRLIFALISLRKYDILYLDEPTNHLDFSTKNVICDILDNYPGTIVMVSHDRFFVNRIATKIVYLQDKKFIIEDGTYDDFIALHKLVNNQFTALLSKEKPTKDEKKVDKPKTISHKKEISRLEQELNKKMEELEMKNQAINDPEKEYDWIEYRKMEEDIQKVEEEIEDIMNNIEKLQENES